MLINSELPNPNIHANQPEWHEGTEGSLTCSYSASSDGEVSIQWLKDGIQLTSSITQLPSLSMSVVKLKSVSTADSGKYTCIASNNVGTKSVSIDMVVFGQYVLLTFLKDLLRLCAKILLSLAYFALLASVISVDFRITLLFCCKTQNLLCVFQF